MDEKELVRRIKNSFKAKKSRAEIIKTMTKKNYKLEYIEALIKKAKRQKKILLISTITITILISLTVTAFAILDPAPTTIGESAIAINNPLDGFKVLFSAKPQGAPSPSPDNPSDRTQEKVDIYLEDIKITPDFIAYLLHGIGAIDTLHKNTITREIPMINFKIENIEYNAAFEDVLKISGGLNPEADIQFNSNKEAIVKATLDDNPTTIFKDSISTGTTTIEMIAGKAELLAKGYLKLYDSLK